jgi:ubiquinone biosynthesis protein
VKIPHVYWEYTTGKILTMEYLHGENIENLKAKTVPYGRKKKIVRKVTEIIFRQIFEHGFFHADPHPGNIFVMKDDTIILLDFGIVGEIESEMKEKLTKLFIALIEGDSKAVADCFVTLQIADKGNVDKILLRHDLKDLLGKYHNTPLSNLDIGSLFHNAIATAKKNKLRLPSELILLGKALITVEGFCVELDPSYNLVETCSPLMIKLKRKELGTKSGIKNAVNTILRLKNFMKNIPDTTEEVIEGINNADKSMDRIGRDIENLNSIMYSSVNRISFVILAVGFLLASVFMMNFGEGFIVGIPLVSFVGFSITVFFILALVYNLVMSRR